MAKNKFTRIYNSENKTVQGQINYTDFDNKPKLLKYTLQKSDNSTLYISRDIAALFERKKKYNFSKIIYVVGENKHNFFKKLGLLTGRLNLSK